MTESFPNPLRAVRFEQKLRRRRKADDIQTLSSLTKDPPPPAYPTVPWTETTPNRGLLAPVAPSYYLAHGLTNPETDKLAFARLANALLPYFSTQDQASVSTFLNTQDPTGLFKDYLGQDKLPSPTSLDDPRTKAAFTSASRAKEALANLDAMRTAAGLTEEQLGSGYKFLRQAISLLSKYGADGANGMTRAEFTDMQAQLDALVSQARGDSKMAPYAELATKFINPTLLGELFPSATMNGQTIYGRASNRLYT